MSMISLRMSKIHSPDARSEMMEISPMKDSSGRELCHINYIAQQHSMAMIQLVLPS